MMKKILILIVLISGCKKSEVAPEPEPTPITKTCQTGKVLFSGKYKCYTAPNDTIEFIFKHNNCPAENSNTYLVDNFVEATKDLVTVPITNPIFEVVSTEVNGYANDRNKEYYFTFQVDSTLKLTGKNLKYGSIKFVKI